MYLDLQLNRFKGVGKEHRYTTLEGHLTTILECRLELSDIGDIDWDRSSSSQGLQARLGLQKKKISSIRLHGI